jgi:hypothetical protein
MNTDKQEPDGGNLNKDATSTNATDEKEPHSKKVFPFNLPTITKLYLTNNITKMHSQDWTLAKDFGSSHTDQHAKT